MVVEKEEMGKRKRIRSRGSLGMVLKKRSEGGRK